MRVCYPTNRCWMNEYTYHGSNISKWQSLHLNQCASHIYFSHLVFFGLQSHCRWWLQPWSEKILAPSKKNYDQSRQHIIKQRHYFAKKDQSSQSFGFSSSHVWMWELDCEESRAPKNWCFWTVVLKKTLENPLDCKEVQPVHPKGDQSWVFIGRTDAEAETPILWPPDAKNWLIRKDPESWKDWR